MATIGHWILRIGLVGAGLCVVPLPLYVVFGPAGGNPIGLGLLLVLGTPACVGVAIVGGIIQVIAMPSDLVPDELDSSDE